MLWWMRRSTSRSFSNANNLQALSPLANKKPQKHLSPSNMGSTLELRRSYVGKTKRRTNDSESTGAANAASTRYRAGNQSATSGPCACSNFDRIWQVDENHRRGYQR